MIRIYHRAHSRSLRVVWLMEELNEPYEIEQVSFPFDESFLDHNPEGTLPFIEDDGIAMAESTAILQYITGRRLPASLSVTIGPNPDPARYAAHLQFLHLGEASLAAALTPILITRMSVEEGDRENVTTGICADVFSRRLVAVERRLEDGRAWIMGDQFTIADISVGYAIGLAEFLGLGDRLTDRVRAYHKRLVDRPAYQRAVAV